MNETRILLASVLKPVNDPRMTRKLGWSLRKLSGVQVHVAGFPATDPTPESFITRHPWPYFRRLSLGRLLVQFYYFRLLRRLKPRIIMAGTFELLPLSLLYKLLWGCTLVYDVRENYALNLRTQRVFTPWLGRILAFKVRLLEKAAAPFIHTFFLAEKSYATELPFLNNRYLVLENKYQPPVPESPRAELSAGVSLSPQAVRLLYTGTISPLYGVLEAIALCSRLNEIYPVFTLTIIGYWPAPETGHLVRQALQDKPYIRLIGGDHLVPHGQIQEAIRESHVGLLPYHQHPSLSRCIPTKLYEYLAAGLPVIVQENPLWEALVRESAAGLVINYQAFKPEELYQRLFNQIYYAGKNLNSFYWTAEEPRLLAWARQTISSGAR